MKEILILLVGVLIISCNQSKKESSDNEAAELTENLENFDWLLGKWRRINEEEGKETFENWDKLSEFEYVGIGFTMQNGDTIKQEKIQLTKINGKWDLIVKVPEESESISFKITKYNESEFICENKEIDFPNMIKYWKNGDMINASVSGGDLVIAFEFERLNK